MATWRDGSSTSRIGKYLEPSFVNVVRFGAARDGSTDDTAEIQAAIDSISNGTVYAPEGTYILSNTLDIPAGVSLLGDGKYGTIFKWTSDLGSGNYAIDANPEADGTLHDNKIQGIQLRGPAGSLVMGTAGCNMDGVKIARRTDLVDCYIQFFRANVVQTADHASVDKCRITNGHYNVLFGAGASTFGDHVFRDTDLTGASMASVAVALDNIIDSSTFDGVHLGFAPYGLMRLTGSPSRGFLSNVTMTDTGFESCGNGCVYGPNSADTVHGVMHSGGGNIDIDGTATYKIAATAVAAGAIRVGSMKRCEWGVGGHYSPLEDAGTAGIIHSTNSIEGCRFHNVQAAIDAATTSLPILTSTTGNSLQNRYTADWTSGLIIYSSTTTAISDVVERTGVDSCKKATATGSFFGVAESAITTNGYIFVATSGVRDVQVAGTVAIGDDLIVDASNPGKLKAATGAAGERIVAVAVEAGTNTALQCSIGDGS